MIENKNIRNFYSTPDGYFENLESRLSKIASPAVDSVEFDAVPATAWMKLKPYMSLAAVFACALVIGSLLLSRTAGVNLSIDAEYEQMFCADLIPITYDMTQMEELFMYDQDEPYMTEDELLEYMIMTGATIDQIEEFSK